MRWLCDCGGLVVCLLLNAWIVPWLFSHHHVCILHPSHLLCFDISSQSWIVHDFIHDICTKEKTSIFFLFTIHYADPDLGLCLLVFATRTFCLKMCRILDVKLHLENSCPNTLVHWWLWGSFNVLLLQFQRLRHREDVCDHIFHLTTSVLSSVVVLNNVIWSSIWTWWIVVPTP